MALLKRRPTIKNIVGQVFGRLTVRHLSERTNKERDALWECQCTCGQTTTCTARSLYRPRQDRSCGKCVSRGTKTPDLTGKQVGYLTVVARTGESTRYGHLWLVRCRCGKELIRNTGNLCQSLYYPRSIPRSCGCAFKDHRRDTYCGVGDLSRTKYHNMVKSSLRKGYPFTATIEYCWDLFLKQDKCCALTGLPLVLDPSSLEKGKSTASLDRIDNSKGHIPGNLQWVHIEVNFFRRDLPLDRFIEWCRLVADHSQKLRVVAA